MIGGGTALAHLRRAYGLAKLPYVEDVVMSRRGGSNKERTPTLAFNTYRMQALNRALHPGAKADYSLVFTGSQGVGKDRVLEAMFTPYYREGIPSPRVNPADFARGIAGAIVAHG